MDHGDDVQEIVFAQLLEPIGQFLHVDVLVPPVLFLGSVFTTDTICVGGAGFLEEGEQLRLWVAEGLIQKRLAMTHNCMCGQLDVPLGA